MKFSISKTVSLALFAILGVGFTACSNGGSGSTSTDVTVERGKVYAATVTDSSSPVQTAVQKANQNVYTFATTPTYPVNVNGGWIDVNGNSQMDTTDVMLDVEMKSYSNSVTPITSFIAAESNATLREQRLQGLVSKLAANNMNVTADSLLKLPSQSSSDVIIASNAIYALAKQGNSVTLDSIQSYIPNIKALISGGTDVANAANFSKELENSVMQNLGAFVTRLPQEYITANAPKSVTTSSASTNLSKFNDAMQVNILDINEASCSASASASESISIGTKFIYDYLSSNATCSDISSSNCQGGPGKCVIGAFVAAPKVLVPATAEEIAAAAAATAAATRPAAGSAETVTTMANLEPDYCTGIIFTDAYTSSIAEEAEMGYNDDYYAYSDGTHSILGTYTDYWDSQGRNVATVAYYNNGTHKFFESCDTGLTSSNKGRIFLVNIYGTSGTKIATGYSDMGESALGTLFGNSKNLQELLSKFNTSFKSYSELIK